MANISCSACEDLRQTDPNLIVNGIGDSECSSLANDTGLSPSAGHNDCTDLNNLNDCLIGNEEANVDAYEVCDWKKFMKQFIPNVWTTFKAIICAICGIWTNIHNLWTNVNKLQCILNYSTQGQSFHFGEYDASGSSHIVAGRGVSFLNIGGGGFAVDILLDYVAGGMSYLSGTGLFYTSAFTDAQACFNYDNGGVDPVLSASRRGNSVWDSDNSKPISGGELVYEIRLKLSEYPQIAAIYEGVGHETAGGGYSTRAIPFYAGQYAFGQHGACNYNTGVPTASGADQGHLVPDGWLYLQMRISYIDTMNGEATGHQYTPYALVPMKINPNAISC